MLAFWVCEYGPNLTIKTSSTTLTLPGSGQTGMLTPSETYFPRWSSGNPSSSAKPRISIKAAGRSELTPWSHPKKEAPMFSIRDTSGVEALST